MKTLFRLFVSFGFFVLAVLIAAEFIVKHYDGRVFDLPEHKLVIMNGGFHLYNKTITYEYKVEEQ